MNRYFTLTKIIIKNALTPIKGNKKAFFKNLALLFIILISLLPMSIGFGTFTTFIYDAFKSLGQEGMILGFGLSIISALTLFFGVFYIISIFYFSKDIENLLYLPVTSSQIMNAKFVLTLLYEYLTGAIIFFPLLIGFGMKSNSSFDFYIMGLIIFLLLPIIPLSIATLLDMLIMRFTNIGKNKDKYRLFGGIIVIFLVLIINTYVQKLSVQNLTPQDIMKMLSEGNNSLISLSSKMFPYLKYPVYALLNSSTISGIINLAMFIVITLGTYFLTMLLANILYLKGVIGISETHSKRKGLSEQELNKNVEKRSQIAAYVVKELKILFRTPVYFMNCILSIFLWPIFFIVPLYSQSGSLEKLNELPLIIGNKDYSSLIFAAIFGLGIFVSSSNSVSVTAISREGSQIYINKYLPISYFNQLIAKIILGILLGFAGQLIMITSLMFILKIFSTLIIFSMFFSLLGMLFINFIGILIDLYFPKLVWDNEQKAVKQNLNVLVIILLGTLFAGLTVLGVGYLKPSILQTVLTLTIIFGLLDILMYRLLKNKGSKLFQDIQA